MLLPTFLSTVTLALTANAFLVPLEVAEKVDFETLNAVPSPHSIHHRVTLNCDSCPYQESQKNGDVAWKAGIKNNLVMDFTTKNNHILLNGVPFFPVETVPSPVKAHQQLAEKDMGFVGIQRTNDVGLSYSLDVQRATKPRDVIITTLDMQVLGIEDQMINVDHVKITIMRNTKSDAIIIAKVETLPMTPTPTEEKCTTIKCRVEAIIRAKFAAIRASFQKAAAKLNSVKSGCAGKLGFRPDAAGHRPHTHGGVDKFSGKYHGHHRGHHGVHRFMHSVVRVFKAILLPILIGVAAGMAASAIGMLIGQIVVLLWMRYRRSSTSAYERVEQVDAEVEEGLPKYEEAPKYEEVESSGEDVVDEKKTLL